MELEKKILRGAVIEGYTVLMRAEAELLLPCGHIEICNFYSLLAEKCMTWAIEVYGEKRRALFLDLQDLSERTRFKTAHYRFRMREPWYKDEHMAIVCESFLKGDTSEGESSYRRISHVWNVAEETILPISLIKELFSCRMDSRRIGFKADGVYPENEELVFYKNASQKNDFMEKRWNFGRNGKI